MDEKKKKKNLRLRVLHTLPGQFVLVLDRCTDAEIMDDVRQLEGWLAFQAEVDFE